MKNLAQFKGIIYRIFNSGSLDKVVFAIDEEGSKVSSIAKSIKKQTSKKAHAVELGNFVKGSYVANGAGLSLLTDLKIIKEFHFWKSEYQQMMFLQLFCEITDEFCYEENKDEELFKILYNTLSIETSKLFLLASAFIIKIIEHSGQLPPLDKCVVSDEKIGSESSFFDYNQIGYISDKIAENYPGSQQVSERIYKAQRFIIEKDIKEAIKLKLEENEEKALFSIAVQWLELATNEKLKTTTLINK